jgi:hypothetical protein
MELFRQPLVNPRLIAKRCPTAPTPAQHKQILHDWAQTIRDGSITKKSNKEAAIRSAFIQKIFAGILGYVPFGSGAAQTIAEEHHTGSGSADAALGHFGGGKSAVIAPVELKGADTTNLDAIMPGRHKSPVQQAWEYAADIPGRKFIVLSNMVEIRLYSYAHTRQVYERFDLLALADSDAEYQRFRLLLGAENLLGGQTEKLLAESANAEKEITQQLYSDYKAWRVQLILALAQNNALPLADIITHAQTILDRMLFIAFAEDRELLPAHTLDTAYKLNNPLASHPVWDNFKGLFRAVDKGNAALGIPAYNGGLFALDAAVDGLMLPDSTCEMFRQLGEYDFQSEVGVAVLGHIFEQSVADLEELREITDLDTFRLKADEAKIARQARGVSGKRKQHGVVYTPDDITAFIVEQTLGGYLEQRRNVLLANYLDAKQPQDEQGNLRYRAPGKEEKARHGKLKLTDHARLTEYLFWHAWRDELQHIKVVDPACGSGAFLIAAFDLLDAEYRNVSEQLQAITGTRDLFDINREILNGNLYGVDLNPESIEITKLSLWLKTAQHGKPLQSLEANLRVGNSLIQGQEFSERAFDWQFAFPDVFSPRPQAREGQGERVSGFDVVLGNPPYVRMERIKPIKPYLEKHYTVASDRADLYCYFFELGVRLLKAGGRLGYISSSTFFKTGSGEPLRRYLLEKTSLLALVDFGDLQVFEGVTTYPAIIVLEKNISRPLAGAGEREIRFLALTAKYETSLAEYFRKHAQTMLQNQLKHDSWQLEGDAPARLRTKLMQGRATLKQIYGSPLYGIKSGLEEAFVVDRATRDVLVAQGPKSTELLKPFLEGKDLKKWRIEPQDLYLIYIPKGVLDIEDYHAIKAHLLPFKAKLEKRATKQAWFELQQAQEVYAQQFPKAKLIYSDISQAAKFSIDRSGSYFPTTGFAIPTDDFCLLSVLNSRVIWWLVRKICPAIRGGFSRLKTQYIETLPIPAVSVEERALLASLAQQCQQAAEARRDTQAAFCQRIPDLAPGGKAKLTQKLERWWELDFAAFRAEAKKLFKQDIPLAERNDWGSYFNSQRDIVQGFTAQIAQHEAALNRAVYALFSLTAEEIALIEA